MSVGGIFPFQRCSYDFVLERMIMMAKNVTHVQPPRKCSKQLTAQ